MSELIRPGTVLSADRRPITIVTADHLKLVGEVATPLEGTTASLPCLHPNPAGGVMMDSHIYKKAANRLPALAGIQVIRFNTRGTSSVAEKSEGTFDNREAESADIRAAVDFCFNDLKVENSGWLAGPLEQI